MDLTPNFEYLRSNRVSYHLFQTFKGLMFGALVLFSGLNSWAQDVETTARLEAYVENMVLPEGKTPGDLKKEFSQRINQVRNQERKSLQDERKKEFDRINLARKEFTTFQSKEKDDFFKNKPNSDEKKNFHKRQAEERKNYFERSIAEKKSLETSQKERREKSNENIKSLTDKFNTKFATIVEAWKKVSEEKATAQKLEKVRHLEVLKDLDQEYEAIGKKKPVNLQAE